ncbi:S8 family serine peptidase [Cumulibacter manganitolerans]|uniref:S8 family serine peptidase n=1 Tax=Cumulibacter manganitolerans TaxID=1884992 RepID=UPI001885F7AA|nr:S8 family serine peptidase [Cumulibacter manganitolerans]
MTDLGGAHAGRPGSVGPRVRRALCLVLLMLLGGTAPAYAAPEGGSAPAACQTPPAPSQVYPKVPWNVSTYDPAERIWPYSTGKGVTVAVVSTGVGAAQSQLAGHVLGGYDFVRNDASGMDDCAGQGTAVATVVAAQQSAASGFVGLAPDARILPVRVAETDQVVRASAPAVTPATVASGIDWAVAQGAQVVVVATVVFQDDPVLAAAVQKAIAGGAVLVAPVGDDHPADGPASAQPTPADRTPYPAAYAGVIGVGAVGPSGGRLPASEVGPYVDLVAPGQDVVAGGPGGGHDLYSGTAVASAFAAAAAALLVGQPGTPWAPGGAGRAAKVEARLRSTASPASGRFAELGYGAGLVDPSRALTELTSGAAAAGATPYVPPVKTERELAQQRILAEGRSRAIGWTWGLLGGLLAVLLGYSVVRRVRRNGGRALTTPPTVETERDQELQYVPGEQLFAAPPEPR